MAAVLILDSCVNTVIMYLLHNISTNILFSAVELSIRY